MKKPGKIANAELTELRARLEEAEQTIEAIRSGKVDALIVNGPAGERIFTLRGADHRYRLIVEGMTEGAVIVNAAGMILYANASFAQLVATPLERVLGTQLTKYVPKGAITTFEHLVREAQTRTIAVETVLLAGPDNPVPVHVSAAADGDVERGGICLIATNLTDAMREAEQRFQFVADMLPQIIWSARPDGWFDYFNRRWFEYTGRSLAETSGWGWKDVLHAEDVARCAEAWEQSVATGAPYEVSYRLKRGADSAYRWHLGRAIPQRGSGGAILRWYGTCTDIEDERALSADAERARDKAEEATRLKDEFLATLSHELRTPLNAILGWGRMLQAGATPADMQTRALDTIVRNAVAQNQLIDDLLDVSRIISGKLRLSVEMVQASHVVEAAIDVVQPAADAKGVRLQRLLDPNAGFVSGDASRLQQVAWNLLSNAVKFTPRDGRVHVSLRRSESYVELSVSDTGAGISSTFLPYVFDRFRQQDGAITRRTGGLGLGLAIVKNIVELHGGTVEAHSDGEGLGSTFLVRIPIVAVRATPVYPSDRRTPLPVEDRSAEVRRPTEVSGLRVLVIDDEADARELVRTVLEHGEAFVHTAASAAEALEMIPQIRPDVIVSDIGMPDGDGYSFIRKLRERSREDGGRTPAIALTAYARPEDRRRALVEGFQTHATKPIDPQELLIVVATLVGRFA